MSLALFCACSVIACSPRKAAESTHELLGTQAERIAAVTKMITRNSPLPSSLIDANFIEEQTGDGKLGPSDLASFCALNVAPADFPAWKAAQAPLEAKNMPAKYVAPKKTQSWWLPAGDFAGLEFYSPKSLTGRYNGWVGIAPDGRIFLYSFTM